MQTKLVLIICAILSLTGCGVEAVGTAATVGAMQQKEMQERNHDVQQQQRKLEDVTKKAMEQVDQINAQTNEAAK